MSVESPTHWILIRGLAREARHWGDFASQFEKALAVAGSTARIDAIDLPGAGRYSEMRSPTSVTAMTEFVREKFLEIRQRQRERGEKPAARIYLVALSLGGMIASRWMERWPDDFAGCVLINTSFKEFSPIYRRLSPLALRHFVGIVRHASDALLREQNVLRMVSNRADVRAQLAPLWAKIHLERPVSYENFARQLLAAARFTPRLVQPPVPTLILNSLGDRMVHPSCSLEISKRWAGADLRRHPTAGHDLTIDAEEWVIDEIVDWFVASSSAKKSV